MSDRPSHRLKILNKLLRGEISAAESYSQVIGTLANSAIAAELRPILERHSLSANRISAFIRSQNAVPEKDSGLWGIFANAVQGTANHFGPRTAMEVLCEGEEMGRNGYQKALLEDDLDAECKRMIREELLPKAIQHVAHLERISRNLASEAG